MAVRHAEGSEAITWRAAAGALGLMSGVTVTQTASLLLSAATIGSERTLPMTPARSAASLASGGIHYRNCDDARQAGAAPVRRGDPGYGGHLDRDGDGVGCE